MVASTAKGPNKSSFLRDVFTRNPSANYADVTQAWEKAGNPGTVSETLVYKVRSEMNLTGGRRAKKAGGVDGAAERPRTRAKASKVGRPKGRAQSNGEPASSARQDRPSRSERGRLIDEIEGDIDRLIFRLMSVGGMAEVEDVLRNARRQLVVLSHRG
jgi:hypothetical protein